MIWWFLFAPVCIILGLPFLMEKYRHPVDPKAMNAAPGNFAELSGGATYFEWHGNTQDPVMVMIHGLSTPSWVFQGLIPGLTMMGFRVLTYDLYGRGLSARPFGAQTQAFFVTQLRELLGDQGITKGFTLFGYSMGGAIATAFAAEEFERVNRLILLAPAGLEYTPPDLLEKAAKWGKIGNWMWGLLGAWALCRAAKADALVPTMIPDLVTRMRHETRTRGYLASILSSERNILSKVQEAEHRMLGNSRVAVVAIWGEKDTIIPLSAVGRLAEWNRNAYKYVIPKAHHSLGYTSPKQVLTAIQESFQEI